MFKSEFRNIHSPIYVNKREKFSNLEVEITLYDDFDEENKWGYITFKYFSKNIILEYLLHYYSSVLFLSFNSSEYPFTIIPAGSATMAMPIKDDIILTIRPMSEVGYISPYPTVVKETVAQ